MSKSLICTSMSVVCSVDDKVDFLLICSRLNISPSVALGELLTTYVTVMRSENRLLNDLVMKL